MTDKSSFTRLVLVVIAALCLSGSALPAKAKNSAKEQDKTAFDAKWIYVSETSAVIYWRLAKINLSSLSYVEYGTTTNYGKRTKISREPRWAQFHRISGLQKSRTYHYRMVNVDPKTKKEFRSADATFRTKPLAGARRIPGRFKGPPYVLSKPGKYILTEDITAGGNAFEITGSDILLDLDGHTVTYGKTSNKQVNGVFIRAAGAVTVCNGHIIDGERAGGYGAAIQGRYNAHPVTVYGIFTDVDRYCQYPMKFFGQCSNLDIHHNHLYSRVTEIESRHYPGNDLLRMDGMQGDCKIHDNLLTEGCHRGMLIGRSKKGKAGSIDIHHNDIRHHQQYVNGYAFAASAAGADIHHNRVTSTGRCVHLCGDGIKFHDNWCDTSGHMILSDLPANSRPWKHQRVELHGIKFEGRNSKNIKVFNNFMRITQYLPTDSQGKGDPDEKAGNGVFIRSKATSAEADTITDSTMDWKPQRWKNYWVKYDANKPASKITSSSQDSLAGKFPGVKAGAEYTIYFKWDYVPATPLNVACYHPDANNEVYNNTIIARTHYKRSRRGGYGASGQWASSIYFVGMNKSASSTGKFSIYIHDNTFMSNDCFISGSASSGMNIRIEKNKFILLKDPAPTANKTAILDRKISRTILNAIKAGENTWVGMRP